MGKDNLNKLNTSGHTGVSKDNFHSGWKVQITVNNRHVHIGRFATLEEAILARSVAEKLVQKEKKAVKTKAGSILNRKRRLYPNRYSKPVCQYTLQGKFIKRYISIAEAAKKCNLTERIIYGACSKHRQSGGGYLWKYSLNDYDIGDVVLCQCCGKPTETDLLASISLDCLRRFKGNNVVRLS